MASGTGEPSTGSDSPSTSDQADSTGDRDGVETTSGDEPPGTDSSGEPPCVPGDEAVFFDGFESGDLSHTEGGVAWTASTSTQVSDAIVHTGDHALRFRFGPGALDEDAFAEQRFTLGVERPELHAQYWLYLPDGSEPGHVAYEIREPEGPDNNKFFRVWHDEYSGPFKWGASLRGSDDGVARLFGETRRGCDIGVGAISGGESWVLPADILGRWVLVRWHVRGDDGSGNGLLRIWLDGRLVIDDHDLTIEGAPCGDNVFLHGYLLGWANSGFDAETFAYIDDVAFSEQPFDTCE